MRSIPKVLFSSLCGLLLLASGGSAGSLDELSALAKSSPGDYGKIFDKNLASSQSAAVRPMSQQQLRQLMLDDLDSVRNTLSARYAPAGWKQEQYGWNLNAEIQRAKDRVNSADSFGVKDYQKLLKTLLGSTRDYHVSVSFYSSEKSFLPFSVIEAGGRYFISGINPELLPIGYMVPFKAGDELTAFDGRPVGDVLTELNAQAGRNNVPQTDRAISAMELTVRNGKSADSIPQGLVSLSVKPAGAAEAIPYQLSWLYSPELIAPQPFVMKRTGRELPMSWLATMMAEFPEAPGAAQASYGMGNKDGFLPDFGKKLWAAPTESPFRAYIYRSPASGRNIGYVRIPTYTVEDYPLMVRKFAAIIREFNRRTDALVVDQTNNPGGKIFYFYALASMLTDTPLVLPGHYITLTQSDVAEAVSFMRSSSWVKTEEDAVRFFGKPDIAGYPVSYDLFKKHSDFYASVIQQWNSGKTTTGPIAHFGLDRIPPSADAHYSKPIMILTNRLDISCGDFFPALMQDNKRAAIFGERTSGAGGAVKAYARDNNLLGVEALSITSSIIERADGQPIENLGVIPDIHYAVTPDDIQGGYTAYIKAADAAISELIK